MACLAYWPRRGRWTHTLGGLVTEHKKMFPILLAPVPVSNLMRWFAERLWYAWCADCCFGSICQCAQIVIAAYSITAAEPEPPPVLPAVQEPVSTTPAGPEPAPVLPPVQEPIADVQHQRARDCWAWDIGGAEVTPGARQVHQELAEESWWMSRTDSWLGTGRRRADGHC